LVFSLSDSSEDEVGQLSGDCSAALGDGESRPGLDIGDGRELILSSNNDCIGWRILLLGLCRSPFLFWAKFLLLVTNRKGLQTWQKDWFFWGGKRAQFFCHISRGIFFFEIARFIPQLLVCVAKIKLGSTKIITFLYDL
jgi:hypothetical protein